MPSGTGSAVTEQGDRGHQNGKDRHGQGDRGEASFMGRAYAIGRRRATGMPASAATEGDLDRAIRDFSEAITGAG